MKIPLMMCCSLLMLVPAVASAQNVEGADEALATDAAIYAKLYGVSQAEAERRIQIMVLGQEEALEEDAAEGDDIAASYFQHDGEFAYVIETKKGTKADKVKKIKSPRGELDLLVKYRKSNKISRKVLKALLRDNKKSVNSIIPSAMGVAYKEREGVLLIEVPDGESPSDLAAEKARLEKIYKVPVVIERLPIADPRISMPGGRHTYTPDFVAADGSQKYKHYCSTAFAARNPAGQLGMLTAGHCSNAFYWSDNGTAGFTQLGMTNKYTSSGDWGFLTGVQIDKRFQANVGEYRAVTGRRTQGTTIPRGYDVYGNYNANGTFVCWYGGESGAQYGQQCGEVTSVTARPVATCGTGTSESPYVPCEYNAIRVEPKAGQSYIYAGDGDSGSPVFAWNTAFGILGTSQHYRASAQSLSVTYTSIDDVYSWNYSLEY